MVLMLQLFRNIRYKNRTKTPPANLLVFTVQKMKFSKGILPFSMKESLIENFFRVVLRSFILDPLN